jgi:hypothetical protein
LNRKRQRSRGIEKSRRRKIRNVRTKRNFARRIKRRTMQLLDKIVRKDAVMARKPRSKPKS